MEKSPWVWALGAVTVGMMTSAGATELIGREVALLTTLIRQVEQDPVLAGINKNEALVDELREAILAPWERSFKARDSKRFISLGPGAQRLGFASAARKLVRDRDGIHEYSWLPRSRGKGAHEVQEYLSRFEQVESFMLEPTKVDGMEGSAVIEVRYDLRGLTGKGGRRHDRGNLRLQLGKANGAWRIVGMEPKGPFESREGMRPIFEDATTVWGLDKVPVSDRKEAIRRGGYAIAAADYDGDGRPDLLVGGWGPVKLYRNTGRRFEDMTRSSGLRGETLVKSAAFADLDNDGRRDLLLLRFVEDGQDKDGDLVVYQNVGNREFVRKGQVLTRTKPYDRAMPITVADFDRNGTLDLYLGFPGSRDFTVLGRDPKPLETQGVWLNDGKWNFKEVSKASEVSSSENLYPHSAVATDLDGDLWPDLVVMNDRAGLSPVYRNLGKGLFKEVSEQSGLVNKSWAMNAAAGDYDGDGFPDLAVTNIDFLAAHRIVESRAGRESGPEEKEALARLRDNAVGNRLFRNRGDGTFKEVTQEAGMRGAAGEAAAGSCWLDYGNSGRHDLYIMNGLWSGGPHDISSLFVRLFARKEVPAEGQLITPLLSNMGDPGGGKLFLGILRRVRGDPRDPAKARGRSPSLSMSGEQRNQLWRNNGDGTFTEIGYVAGADRVEDGYVAALADVDGDGNQDLILRNADPAPGRNFPAVTLLLNKNPKRRNSLTVFAQGEASNRDGIGARVTAWVGGKKIVREVQGPVGAAQSEPVAFFGLGTRQKADRLEVVWPSGLRERFVGVPAGRVVLREGKGYKAYAVARQASQ